MKIARTSVKPIPKRCSTCSNKLLNMSKEATQSKWDNLTAWACSTCTQVPEGMIISCLVIVNDLVV